MVRRDTGRNLGTPRRRAASHLLALGGLAAVVIAAACGTTSRTSTGPTPLKCQPSVALATSSIGAVGGSGALSVTTQQECTWSVSSEVGWISSLSPASGQGSAQVTFSVATNPEASMRQGDLVVNDQRVHLRQEAAACKFEIAPKSRALDAGADEWPVNVTAVPGCTWRATSNNGWMTVMSGETGTRDGVVVIRANSNGSADPRTGSLTIAGETFAVAQSGTTTSLPPPATPPPTPPSPSPPPPAPPEVVCTYLLSPATHSAPAGGGDGSTSMQTNHPGCVWAVSSDSSWLTASTGVGVGSQPIGFTVAANAGVARTGRLTIGGQLLTVTQAAVTTPGPGPGPSCTYSINPTSLNAAAAGVTGTNVSVTAGTGCAWTAVATVSWITIASGASGSGSGTVGLNIAANSGAARTGTATIAGQTFTVTQAAAPAPPPPPACVYSITPPSQSIGPLGGPAGIDVSTTSACGWTATTAAGWIVIVSGTSGSGNGTATLAIAANLGAARVGTVTIAGQTYTVNQAAALPPPPPPPPTCSYSINPTNKNIGAGGATKQKIDVQTTSSCTWNAASNVSWLSISKGASGQGNGEVEYDVENNDGPARSGTLTVAGQTFTVNQAGHACSYSISPSSQSFTLLGGLGSVSVTGTPGCSWTATSNAAWIIVTLGGSGTGDGSVLYTVTPNVSGSRQGTITIAGRTFTVSQN